MALRLITPPAGEPVTRQQVEDQVRADLSAESALIDTYISALRQKAETYLRRALMRQTWELTLDAFPIDCRSAITLPLPPLQSVTSIKYTDMDGNEQTLDPALYKVDTASEPARIVPAYGKLWPQTRSEINAVRIRFVCGFSLPDFDAFDAAAAYSVGDQISSNGKAYRCAVATEAGTLPTDTGSWVEISETEAVPQCVKQWLLLNISDLYENRGMVVVGERAAMVDVTTLADGLLDSVPGGRAYSF